jgi:Enterobacter phage Enc34, ssDNA-binding protein
MALNPKNNICVMTKSGTMVLPAGRLSYPNLFKMRAMPGASPDTAKYSLSFMMPADADLSLASNWVNKTASDQWGPEGSKKFKKPFLKHEEKTEDLELAKAFPYLVRCSTVNKPTVVFGNGEACTIEDEVYAGRWARITVRCYAWEHPLSGRGVSFGLSNVMLLEHDDRIGGGRAKAEDEFGEFFEKSDAAPWEDGKARDSKNPDSIFN